MFKDGNILKMTLYYSIPVKFRQPKVEDSSSLFLGFEMTE